MFPPARPALGARAPRVPVEPSSQTRAIIARGPQSAGWHADVGAGAAGRAPSRAWQPSPSSVHSAVVKNEIGLAMALRYQRPRPAGSWTEDRRRSEHVLPAKRAGGRRRAARAVEVVDEREPASELVLLVDLALLLRLVAEVKEQLVSRAVVQPDHAADLQAGEAALVDVRTGGQWVVLERDLVEVDRGLEVRADAEVVDGVVEQEVRV